MAMQSVENTLAKNVAIAVWFVAGAPGVARRADDHLAQRVWT